jgi:hypothetical protein
LTHRAAAEPFFMSFPPLRNRRVRTLVLSLVLSDMAFSAYCGWRYLDDNRWLATTATRVVTEAKAVSPRERAAALRDYVRARVKHAGAEHDARPFLRHTARETLESGLGYCGESTRALVRLAAMVGLRCQRVNLRGPVFQHVVAEIEVEPGRFVLYDAQDNPDFNPYFDGAELTADELIVRPDSPFFESTNLNLRRMPFLGWYVQRVKMHQGRLSTLFESPWLIDALALQALAVAVVGLYAADRLLLRFYSWRTDRGTLPWGSRAPALVDPAATETRAKAS